MRGNTGGTRSPWMIWVRCHSRHTCALCTTDVHWRPEPCTVHWLDRCGDTHIVSTLTFARVMVRQKGSLSNRDRCMTLPLCCWVADFLCPRTSCLPTLRLTTAMRRNFLDRGRRVALRMCCWVAEFLCPRTSCRLTLVVATTAMTRTCPYRARRDWCAAQHTLG